MGSLVLILPTMSGYILRYLKIKMEVRIINCALPVHDDDDNDDIYIYIYMYMYMYMYIDIYRYIKQNNNIQ